MKSQIISSFFSPESLPHSALASLCFDLVRNDYRHFPRQQLSEKDPQILNRELAMVTENFKEKWKHSFVAPCRDFWIEVNFWMIFVEWEQILICINTFQIPVSQESLTNAIMRSNCKIQICLLIPENTKGHKIRFIKLTFACFIWLRVSESTVR